MYPIPPPEIDRTVTWRSIIAGYALIMGIFVIMVAISYPKATVAIIAAGTGMYVLYWTIQAAAHADRLCIPRTRICLHLSRRPR